MKNSLYGKIALPVLIGIVVAIFLFNKDFEIDNLKEIKINATSFIGFGLALFAIAMRESGMAFRFKILTDGKLNLKKSFRTTFLCEFTSAITPSSVGGSALSMVFMHREGISLGKSTTLTFTILFLDMLFFTVASPLIVICSPSGEIFRFATQSLNHSIRALFWVAYGGIVAITLILLMGIFLLPTGFRKLLDRIGKWKRMKKWKDKLEELSHNMLTTSIELKNKRIFWWVQAFGVTVLSWIGRFLVVNGLFLALVPEVSQWTVFARQIVVWALLMFSPTPGGSGVSEWLFDKYYGDLIGGNGIVMVMAILWRILTYYIYLFIGLFFLPWFFRKQKLENNDIIS